MGQPYILVTGASSAIGSEIAKILSINYNLILHGRNTTKLLKLKNELNCCVILWEYDLTDIADLSKDFVEFLESNNIIDIYGFIHVSGSTEVFPIRTGSIEQWIDMFNINLFSGVLIVRELIKKKYKNYFKTCVFISSTYAHFGGKGQSAYCASKAAVEGFVRSAAIELAPNVCVNCIVPGGVINERYDIENDYIKNLELAHPLGFGKPEDIANMAEYLVSEKARWITGQSFVVDGGYSINNLK